MLTRTKRKYIDSHWLVFFLQGAVALLFGWFVMFTGNTDISFLVTIVSCMLLAFGLIELFNVLHRERLQETWLFSLGIAAFELLVAAVLLLTPDQNPAWYMGAIALYTVIRGVLELFIALKSIDDRTDRFIWLLCGISGVVIGFAVLNSGHLSEGMFMRFFGSYLVILGMADLIYGIHNREQKLDAASARQISAQKSAKTRALNKLKTATKRKIKE